jgi:uncharacterized protein YcfL
MNQKFASLVLAAALFMSCSSNSETENKTDSANILHDTMPAIDSIAIDSNPADHTRIDSLQQ